MFSLPLSSDGIGALKDCAKSTFCEIVAVSLDNRPLHSGKARAIAEVLSTVMGCAPKRPDLLDRFVDGLWNSSLNFRVPSPSGLKEKLERFRVSSSVVV